MTDESTVWRSLAALLPPAQAQEVMDCWTIGEQEGALDLVVSGLLARDIPISGIVRAQLVVTSEMWGQREALEERIGRCRSLSDDDSDLRVLVSADAVPLTGASLSDSPELADLLVVPWIVCAPCGQVLGRAHEREPWGDLSFLAAQYVLFRLFRPRVPAQTQVFSPAAVREALTILASSCATTGTAGSAAEAARKGCADPRRR
ncbi:hypothetical protein [Streptomyces sp. NPDC007205]|uniref:hypothetical protein n=1 Tax=Streptomyces sp. NPDC007205 TaxID=3154316 RepID=UPI0033E3871F